MCRQWSCTGPWIWDLILRGPVLIVLIIFLLIRVLCVKSNGTMKHVLGTWSLSWYIVWPLMGAPSCPWGSFSVPNPPSLSSNHCCPAPQKAGGSGGLSWIGPAAAGQRNQTDIKPHVLWSVPKPSLRVCTWLLGPLYACRTFCSSFHPHWVWLVFTSSREQPGNMNCVISGILHRS